MEKLGARPAFYRISYGKGEDSPIDQLAVVFEAGERISIPSFALPEDAASRLWLHVHRREHKNRITHLILDQFEEIFTLGAEWPEADAEVRQALAILVQGAIPPLVETLLDEGVTFLKHFHLDVPPLPVLLSLREDYVFALNRWRSYLPQLGQNHFELRSLRGLAAFDAVFKPGELRCHYRGEIRKENEADTGLPPIIRQETARRIVSFIAEKKEDVPLEEIEAVPPILSLLCRELNERRYPQPPGAFGPPLAEIVFDEQRTNVETILETFYERSLAGRPEAVRIFIEEDLVSRSGIRLQNDEHSIIDVFASGCEIPGDDMGRHAVGYGDRSAATICLRALVNQRLLSPVSGGENPRYELTHDLLCRIVYKSRTARQERLEKERLEHQAKEEIERAQERAKEVRVVLSQANVSLARYSKDFGKNAQALAHLAQALRLNQSNPAAAKLTGAMLTQTSWPILLAGPMCHDRAVYSVQFSPDGQRVVTASEDKTAQLWDALSGKPIGEPMRHGATVISTQFSPDGQRVVTASEDGTARLWDSESGKQIGEPMRHGATVYSAQFSADGQRVVTASENKTAQLWDALSGEPIGEPMRHGATVYSAQFSVDGQRVVTASEDKTAQLWDTVRGKPIGEPMRHGAAVISAQFSPDGQRVVTASVDTARLWDALSGEPIGEPMRHGARVRSAQFSSDGQRVVTASGDNTARLWDALSGKAIGEPMQHGDTVTSVQFSPDGQRVVAASVDKTARLWDALSGKPIGEPMQHGDTVTSAQFSADGQRVVTASEDNTARLWDALKGKPIGEPMRHGDTVTSAQFNPDGQRVLTASVDTARLWDVLSGKPISEPMRHEARLRSAQFSPDGQWIVTASGDNTARLWDALSGKPIGDPIRHGDTVTSAQFSPDGQRVVTASVDNTARLWDFPTISSKDSAEDLRMLADLAEATGGIALQASGQEEIQNALTSEEIQAIREKIATSFPRPSSELTPLQRLLKWSVSDPRDRTISPSSQLTVAEWIENTINEGTLDGLRAAMQVYPANARLTAHLGQRLADQALETRTDPDAARRARPEADFQTRRALKLAPDNDEVKKLRAHVVQLLKLPE